VQEINHACMGPRPFHTVGIAGKINPMPWPATHILIAEKVYDEFFKHLDRNAFLIGTCFPDIRYPAKIDRQRTHVKDLSLSYIRSQPAFQAGMYFHNMVDGVWNGYVGGFYETLFSVVPHDQAMLHTLKILQDKYLYPFYTVWDQIAVLFTTVLPEERTFGIDEAMLLRWHKMLALYLHKPPDRNDLEMLSISLPGELVSQIRHYYQAFEAHPTLQNIMTGFYTDFEAFLRVD